MAIPVQCQCGKKFSAKPELAGKKARCPACKSTLTVPKPQAAKKTAAKQAAKGGKRSAAADQIEVQCKCGARFGAGSHLAGKRVACPKCKSPLQISAPKKVEQKPVSSPAAKQKESITVQCQCGAKFAAGAHLAGKKVACPKCKQPLKIEAGGRPTPAAEPTLIPMDDEPAEAAAEPFALGVVEPTDIGGSTSMSMPTSGFDDIFASASEFSDSAPAFTPQAPVAAAPSSTFAPSLPRATGPKWSVGTWMIVATGIFCFIPFILAGMMVVFGLVSPILGGMIAMLFSLYMLLFLLVVIVGSFVCMFMVMAELWNDGNEMVVVLCFFLGLAPCTYVCGWLFGSDRTVMIIWSILGGSSVAMLALFLCLQSMFRGM